MKLFRSGSLMAVAVVTLFLVGCASWTPPIKKDDQLSGTDTFLYGKFGIDSPKTFLGMDGYQTMGFIFSCRDGKSYTIRFSVEQPLQVIKLSPATCGMTEIVYTNGDGQIRTRKPAPKGFFDNLVLKAGSAYYLGDYFAVVETTSVRTEWKIKETKNQFAATTDELKATYPNMAKFETVNVMLGK